MMARIVWKGAIAFGLVHVPIVVHAASRPNRLDFDWIDRRDNAPVGYQRINKRTGRTIDSEHIVKGYEYEKGEYVYMNDEDFARANVAATQTVEILDFVKADDVPLYYFDTPYYLAPDRRGGPGYALLHRALRESGRIGIAQVVLHTRQHLAAVMPVGEVLMLVTMRYADEIVPAEEFGLDDAATHDKPGTRELRMAMRLLDDMTRKWDPAQYRDAYRDDLMAAIEKKVRAGKTHELAEPGEAAPRASAKVIDLAAMLQQSLERGKRRSGAAAAPAKKAAPARKTTAKGAAAKRARKTPTRRAPARKAA
ncbi:Ku protein [Bordetella bronchiseptica]|nr:Ku protein [Bordetella bronchiseptica]